MSQPNQQPRLDVRGAVDLSALARPAPADGAGATPAPGPGPYTVDVTEATFGELVQSCDPVPGGRPAVVVPQPRPPASTSAAIWVCSRSARPAPRWRASTSTRTARSPPPSRCSPCPRWSRCWPGSRSRCSRAPTRPSRSPRSSTSCSRRPPRTASPAAPREATVSRTTPRRRSRRRSRSRRCTRRRTTRSSAATSTARPDAYARALRENPRDAMARAGLAQVGLLQRTHDVDARAAREAAAGAPLDVDAQFLVADLDVLGGMVDDAFSRLVDLVRRTSGDDRERVRVPARRPVRGARCRGPSVRPRRAGPWRAPCTDMRRARGDVRPGRAR